MTKEQIVSSGLVVAAIGDFIIMKLIRKVGTRSILYGAHCFFLHPWFVAAAWRQLYGFPWDPRLWVAFFVHDLGYIGKADMDGQEGETHVELGANIMGWLFGARWKTFCLYHSRFYAKRDAQPFSRLCVADKLAICLTPAWLYLPLARASGEIYEYMDKAADGKYASMHIDSQNQYVWYGDMCFYLAQWVAEHKDGRKDLWTPAS